MSFIVWRVNSYDATQFRIWATNTLKEYIKKVWVVKIFLIAGSDSKKYIIN